MRRWKQDPVPTAVVGLIAVVVAASVITTVWEAFVVWLSVAFFIGIGVLLIAVMVKGGFIRWPR